MTSPAPKRVVAKRRGGRPFPRGARARGAALLEVVLAVLILGLVTSSISGALAFVYKRERQETLRLAANEIANRLILQYLDDETVIDRMKGRPLDYGVNRFAWNIDVQRVGMHMKLAEIGSGRPRPQFNDRFELVTVQVWLDSSASMGRAAVADQDGAPLAELSRLLDPAAARNSDAMARLGKDTDRVMRLVERMGLVPGAGGSGGAGRQPPGRGNPGSNPR